MSSNSPFTGLFDLGALDRKDIIVIEPGEGLSSKLKMNFSSYISTYMEMQADPTNPIIKKAHMDIQGELNSAVKGVHGPVLWKELLNSAIERRGLAPEKIDEIKHSPIDTFMQDSFIEILKNTMDAIIVNACQNKMASVLELGLVIDLSVSDEIGLRLIDNGPGFKKEFLDSTSNVQRQISYMNGVGSLKRKMDDGMHPQLFGGAGRGLRMLLSKVIYGDELVATGVRERKFEPLKRSEIKFSLRRDGHSGAVIEIITSLAPLKEVKKPVGETGDALGGDEEVVIQLPPPRVKKTTPPGSSLGSAGGRDPDCPPSSLEGRLDPISVARFRGALLSKSTGPLLSGSSDKFKVAASNAGVVDELSTRLETSPFKG